MKSNTEITIYIINLNLELYSVHDLNNMYQRIHKELILCIFHIPMTVDG